MKRRFFYNEGTKERANEEELNNLIPDSAGEDACRYIDKEFEPWAKGEIKERVMIVDRHDLFSILTESSSEYRIYEFKYNPLSDEVRFVKYEGDWK